MVYIDDNYWERCVACGNKIYAWDNCYNISMKHGKPHRVHEKCYQLMLFCNQVQRF